jgi:isoquinoline 1-oxidoreductase beta subunit
MTTEARPQRFSRRTFLKATGWTAAGLTVVYLVGRKVFPVFPSTSDPDDDTGAAWLQVRSDGRVAMLCPVHELGQGSSIGLAQIAAEELGVAAADIDIRFPSTREIPNMRFTTGSQSIAVHARPMARAAAALREELRRRAASQLGVAPGALRDGEAGFVLEEGRAVPFREIVRGAAVVLDAGELPEAPLYTFDAHRKHRQVGLGIAQFQALDIVTGRALFAADQRLPDLVYGRALQAPLAGARIVKVDEKTARAVPGVIAVVIDRERDFVGVVAETPGAVTRALAQLRVTWDRPAPFTHADIERAVDVDQALARGKLERRLVDDDLQIDRPWEVDLRFDLPILHHAAQEPRSAVARFAERGGEEVVEIWTGSQDTFVNQKKAAAELSWPVDRVVVHAMRLGGAFGGRAIYDVTREALLLARAVKRPVKVEWSRHDEFLGDRNRPPSSHRVRIRSDGQGRVTDWWHAVASGHVLLSELLAPQWLLPPLRMAMADFGATRGLRTHYAAARKRIEFSDVELPIHVGQWRSLGATPNNFAIECAIDELARELGRDPVEFRLQNLPPAHARLTACLTKVRELCEARPRNPRSGFGRGYACGIYHDHSYVAVACDVFVDRPRQQVRVLRACCAQDVGLAINPDQIKAQIEGNVMLGIGQVLMEEAKIANGRIAAKRFSDYPTPTLADAPEFEIALISDRSAAPAGAGETALIAAMPALANAIRDATGVRVTRLPLRFEALSARAGGAAR